MLKKIYNKGFLNSLRSKNVTKLKRYYTETDNFTITDGCKASIKSNMISKDKLLRLGVLGGEGCSGFSYKFESVIKTSIEKSDFVLKFDNEEYVVIDEESIILLNGIELDFEDEIARTGYFVKDNPNADSSCSCKVSFSPKDSLF